MKVLVPLLIFTSLAFSQVVQVGQVATNSTSSATNMTGATLMVACITGYYANPCASSGSGGSTLTDSQGNTWTQVGTARTNGAVGHCMRYAVTASCSTPPCASSTQTFTISGGTPTVQVFGFSAANTSPVDPGINASNTVSSTSVQAGPVTPSANGDLLMACFAGGGPPQIGRAHV